LFYELLPFWFWLVQVRYQEFEILNFFVGCGAIFTAPFFDINSTNNINMLVKSSMVFGAWKPLRRSSSGQANHAPLYIKYGVSLSGKRHQSGG
jgi:hypothetical protein